MASHTDTDPTRTKDARTRRLLAGLVAAVLLLAVSAADAKLTTDKCLVSKRKAWTALRKCQGTEEAKKLLGKAADLAKCDTKFQEKLAQINDKAKDAGIACRYGDNGDGTVTDYDTGLQWEKKTGVFVIGGGFFCNSGDVHCVNDTYNWEEANLFVDGSANGVTRTTCFFGHCDWRLPTIVELQTILLEPNPCGTNPCIDPIFGPTVGRRFYWSATTLTFDLGGAWLVDFTDGGLGSGAKGAADLYVRAVRTGL